MQLLVNRCIMYGIALVVIKLFNYSNSSISDMNGMLVQNCYVEDGQGNRILIIDQNG